MPAPDLPPPIEPPPNARPLRVHLHVRLVTPQALRDGVVIVIDALRASVTITTMLAHGAKRVIPCLTVEDALSTKNRLLTRGEAPGSILLGGERGGVLIPGFDADNSPRAYSPERVRGRTVIFTTSNGTAALLHARQAAEVLVGSLVNAAAACHAVEQDPRPVHILCCGTREQISMDDILPAGLMVRRLLNAGRVLDADDSGRVAQLASLGAERSPGGVPEAMRASRGGRNLGAVGLAEDVDACSRIDSFDCVPGYDVTTNTITLRGSARS